MYNIGARVRCEGQAVQLYILGARLRCEGQRVQLYNIGARVRCEGQAVQRGPGQRQHPGREEQFLQAPDSQARQEEQVGVFIFNSKYI